MTVLILAIDALDAGLVDYFEADEFRLLSSEGIETFAHSQKKPYTPEVWATVATGVGPEEHGITASGTSEWDNPLFSFASRFTGHFRERIRGQMGRFVRQNMGMSERLAETELETIFDRNGAVVHNWPGVHDGSYLQRAWDIMGEGIRDMPRSDFERELMGLAAQQFGWAREMLRHDVSLAGVHVHTLDAAGHAYGDDEAALRYIYECVGEYVIEITKALGADDELLLLSDHGITTSFYDADENPGNHSWRAYASATTDDVPGNVFDVVDWIDRHVKDVETHDVSVDLPEDQLRDLGYID